MRRSRGLGLLLLVTFVLIGVFEYQFADIPFRRIARLESNDVLTRSIEIKGLTVMEVGTTSNFVSLRGAVRGTLVDGRGVREIQGSSQLLMEWIGRAAGQGSAKLLLTGLSQEVRAQISYVDYACCGEDSLLEIGYLLDQLATERIQQLRGSEVVAVVSFDAPECSFDDPKHQCVFGNFADQELEGQIVLDSALQFSSFEMTNLDSAVFADTNLEGASFRGSSLRGALFLRSDLSGADFTGADLEGAVFSSSRTISAVGIPPGLRTEVAKRIP